MFQQDASLEERVAALEAAMRVSVHWLGAPGERSFAGAWTNFDNAPPGYGVHARRHAYYYVDRGRCYLGGCVKGGTTGSVAFQVEEFARYPGTSARPFTVPCSGGTAQVDVFSNGNIIPMNVTGNVNAGCFLEGISWMIGG